MKPPSTARTAGRSGGCGGACDASRLSCFLFRPRKRLEKRRKRSHTNVSNALVTQTSRLSQTLLQTPLPCFHAFINEYYTAKNGLGTIAPRLLSQVKVGTHSPFGEESHTTAHTAKRGPSLPRPQHGLVPSAKFLLVLHAFIYIHFPVHCEPSTPAEEKNLSKLPSQTLSQTIFHRVFQLLSQMAHVRFHERKWVHARLSEKDRTQGLTRRNTGLPDGGAIITLDTSCTFTNIPGPGVRTANFAAFAP